MSFAHERQPNVTILLSFVMNFRILLATIRKYSIKFEQVRKLLQRWDRCRLLDMYIYRSQLDNLRHQTLVDERNANA